MFLIYLSEKLFILRCVNYGMAKKIGKIKVIQPKVKIIKESASLEEEVQATEAQSNNNFASDFKTSSHSNAHVLHSDTPEQSVPLQRTSLSAQTQGGSQSISYASTAPRIQQESQRSYIAQNAQKTARQLDRAHTTMESRSAFNAPSVAGSSSIERERPYSAALDQPQEKPKRRYPWEVD